MKDSHGRTPLFWAAQKNHLSVAKALLQAGADPNATEDGATSPFLLGDLLLPIIPDSPVSRDCEALINCTRPGGQTPLFFAAGKGYHNMTKLLLNHGADPKIQDNYGETALCWAAGKRCESIGRLLLHRGAIPDPVGDSTQSPLLWAVRSQGQCIRERLYRGLPKEPGMHWEDHPPSHPGVIVGIFLEHGADPSFLQGVKPVLSTEPPPQVIIDTTSFQRRL